MFEFDIDIPKMNKLQNKLEHMPTMIDMNIKRYLQLLLGSGAVSVQGTLKHKINELVYSQTEPKYYERTYSLFNAVRASLQGNTINLYIDDEWLSKRPHVSEESMSTGTAVNARPNSPTPYSIRVEEDFEYRNQPLNVDNNYNRQGSHYMEATFYQLLNDIQNGDKDASKILQPILRSWSR